MHALQKMFDLHVGVKTRNEEYSTYPGVEGQNEKRQHGTLAA